MTIQEFKTIDPTGYRDILLNAKALMQDLVQATPHLSKEIEESKIGIDAWWDSNMICTCGKCEERGITIIRDIAKEYVKEYMELREDITRDEVKTWIKQVSQMILDLTEDQSLNDMVSFKGHSWN